MFGTTESYRSYTRTLALVACWFGIAAGLLEGCAFVVGDRAGWLSWEVAQQGKDMNVLWAAVLVNTALFLIIALMLLPLGYLVHRRRWQRPLIIVFATLAAYPTLSSTGRLDDRAMWILALGVGVAVARAFVRDFAANVSRLKRTLVVVATIALFVGLSVRVGYRLQESVRVSSLPEGTPGAPNVLLIVLDTVRADRLGCYGYSRPTTPFLDDLARESVLFENAFANAPWSLPSHSSLFTGRTPAEHGAHQFALDRRVPTVSEYLAAHGYMTAAVVANSWVVNKGFGLNRGFIHWENGYVGVVDSIRRTTYGLLIVRRFYWAYRLRLFIREPGEMDAVEVNRRFLRWLDQRPKRPFFAFLNYMDAHPPLDPPREFAARFRQDPAAISGRALGLLKFEEGRLSAGDLGRLSDGYDASLAYLDHRLRELFAALARRRLDNNLLVIITSDHGELMGEHGLMGHQRSLYLSELKVPLIVRFFGARFHPGRVQTLVGLDAVAATIAEYANLAPGPFPSPSLNSLQARPPDQGSVVAEVRGRPWLGMREGGKKEASWLKSLITPEWHLILAEGGRTELFRWPVDKEESRNLASRPENGPVVARLRQMLDQRRNAVAGRPVSGGASQVTSPGGPPPDR
jgi:arylsulfatase A-like enzyme